MVSIIRCFFKKIYVHMYVIEPLIFNEVLVVNINRPSFIVTVYMDDVEFSVSIVVCTKY